MNTCPKCGAKIEADSNFCSKCGSLVEATADNIIVSTEEHYQKDVGFKQMFLRTDGRLNRKRYILRQLCVGAIGSISALILAGLGMLTGNMSMAFVAVVFASIISCVLGIPLAIRRMHDVNRSGKTLLLLLLSLAIIPALWVGYLLVFKKGTEGSNQYGADPLA